MSTKVWSLGFAGWCALGLTLGCGSKAQPPVDVAGPWTGPLRSSRFTDVGADLLLTQSGANLSGSWALRGGGAGSFAGTVTGSNVRFTLTQTTMGCAGTLNGTAVVRAQAMTISFTGTDCQGSIASGEGTLTRPDPASSISGTAFDKYISTDGEVGLSRDLTGALEVLVSDGNGGFTTPTVQASALGTFRVDNVPANATYYLRLDKTYVVGSARTLDLGSAHLGRPGVAVSGDGTSLILDVDGMTAWQSGDDLEVVSVGTGTSTSVLSFNSPVTAGATSIAGLETDWTGEAVIDSGLADRAMVVHLVARASDGGQSYIAAKEVAELSPFTIASESSVRTSGTFAAITQNLNAQFELRSSVFASNRTRVHAQAETVSQALFVAALPQADTRGVYSTAPTLMLLNAGTGTLDTSTGTVTFGNPYPAAWTLIGAAQVQYQVVYELPGASRPVRIFATTTHVDAVGELVAAPIAPLVGPASAPKVNDRDATGDLTGVGLTPTVSWAAPSSGTATYYTVTVTKLLPTGGFGQRRQVMATIFTSATSVQIPPSVLESGQYYVLTIASRHAPGVDLAKRPLQRALPSSTVEMLTGLLSP